LRKPGRHGRFGGPGADADKNRQDANTLLMGGMVMVGAVALQKPAVDRARIQPQARLTQTSAPSKIWRI
jgi:hypothetical protein